MDAATGCGIHVLYRLYRYIKIYTSKGASVVAFQVLICLHKFLSSPVFPFPPFPCLTKHVMHPIKVSTPTLHQPHPHFLPPFDIASIGGLQSFIQTLTFRQQILLEKPQVCGAKIWLA